MSAESRPAHDPTSIRVPYTLTNLRSTLRVLAHLALWAACYVAAAVVCFAQMAGIDSLVSRPDRVRAAAFSFLVAGAVYLLDRVKLRDAWLDPADSAAHPERFAFLQKRTGVVRMAI